MKARDPARAGPLTLLLTRVGIRWVCSVSRAPHNFAVLRYAAPCGQPRLFIPNRNYTARFLEGNRQIKKKHPTRAFTSSGGQEPNVQISPELTRPLLGSYWSVLTSFVL